MSSRLRIEHRRVRNTRLRRRERVQRFRPRQTRERGRTWQNEAPGGSGSWERTVHLISESAGDDDRTFERWLRRHYSLLFEMELNDWYTDPTLWPSERSYEFFRQWFEPELYTVLRDLAQGAIYDGVAPGPSVEGRRGVAAHPGSMSTSEMLKSYRE